MNILQVANKAIYPPDGGALAILNLAKGYIRNGHKVHVLNMLTHKHYNNQKVIEKEYRGALKIEGIMVNTKISPIKLALNLLFSYKPYIAQRFVSTEFRLKLIKLLQNNNYDLVQLEGLYVLQYINAIRKNFNGVILYRPHNIEYLIWKRNYTESKKIWERWYYKILFKRLRNLEKKLINTYDFLIPISESDARIYKELGNKKPVKTAPFGLDIKKITHPRQKENKNGVLNINYIGALDWIPNQEGLLWFIQNCFGEIIRTFPNVELTVAGRNAPSWFIKKLGHPNINYLGEVENAYDFLLNAGPVIVPLFSGSGMRVKIIESMALKKAVVATNIAAEGINCTNHHNIILANHPYEFSGAVIKLLNNEGLQREIGENAYIFVKEYYDFIKIAADTLNFIK